MKICIQGQPFGKQRPKATTINGFVRVYTPKETINYENLVKYEYQSQSRKFFEKDEPLEVNIMCVYQIPTSFSKKKTQNAIDNLIKPMVKPDLDNVAKIVLDALNGIAFADDKQIIKLSIEKRYGVKPYLELEINKIEQ